ncbi:MAG: 50S ribosomal protein L21 [Odoribacter sp.]|nr:50S ribosomal protein L21 [Odoribacter sp.]
MYAIVEIAGQQFKVEEGKNIFVHRLEVENEKMIEFDQVLLIEDDGKVIIGDPTIKDAVVEGKILEQLRGDKVIVFKKKRKKGYRIRNGHRQYFTQVQIVSIKEKTAKKAVKKEEVTVTEKVSEPVLSAEVKGVKKKPAVKKAAPVKAEKKVAPVKKISTKKAETVKKPAARKPAKGKE